MPDTNERAGFEKTLKQLPHNESTDQDATLKKILTQLNELGLLNEFNLDMLQQKITEITEKKGNVDLKYMELIVQYIMHHKDIEPCEAYTKIIFNLPYFIALNGALSRREKSVILDLDLIEELSNRNFPLDSMEIFIYINPSYMCKSGCNVLMNNLDRKLEVKKQAAIFNIVFRKSYEIFDSECADLIFETISDVLYSFSMREQLEIRQQLSNFGINDDPSTEYRFLLKLKDEYLDKKIRANIANFIDNLGYNNKSLCEPKNLQHIFESLPARAFTESSLPLIIKLAHVLYDGNITTINANSFFSTLKQYFSYAGEVQNLLFKRALYLIERQEPTNDNHNLRDLLQEPENLLVYSEEWFTDESLPMLANLSQSSLIKADIDCLNTHRRNILKGSNELVNFLNKVSASGSLAQIISTIGSIDRPERFKLLAKLNERIFDLKCADFFDWIKDDELTEEDIKAFNRIISASALQFGSDLVQGLKTEWRSKKGLLTLSKFSEKYYSFLGMSTLSKYPLSSMDDPFIKELNAFQPEELAEQHFEETSKENVSDRLAKIIKIKQLIQRLQNENDDTSEAQQSSSSSMLDSETLEKQRIARLLLDEECPYSFDKLLAIENGHTVEAIVVIKKDATSITENDLEPLIAVVVANGKTELIISYKALKEDYHLGITYDEEKKSCIYSNKLCPEQEISEDKTYYFRHPHDPNIPLNNKANLRKLTKDNVDMQYLNRPFFLKSLIQNEAVLDAMPDCFFAEASLTLLPKLDSRFLTVEGMRYFALIDESKINSNLINTINARLETASSKLSSEENTFEQILFFTFLKQELTSELLDFAKKINPAHCSFKTFQLLASFDENLSSNQPVDISRYEADFLRFLLDYYATLQRDDHIDQIIKLIQGKHKTLFDSFIEETSESKRALLLEYLSDEDIIRLHINSDQYQTLSEDFQDKIAKRIKPSLIEKYIVDHSQADLDRKNARFEKMLSDEIFAPLHEAQDSLIATFKKNLDTYYNQNCTRNRQGKLKKQPFRFTKDDRLLAYGALNKKVQAQDCSLMSIYEEICEQADNIDLNGVTHKRQGLQHYCLAFIKELKVIANSNFLEILEKCFRDQTGVTCVALLLDDLTYSLLNNSQLDSLMHTFPDACSFAMKHYRPSVLNQKIIIKTHYTTYDITINERLEEIKSKLISQSSQPKMDEKNNPNKETSSMATKPIFIPKTLARLKQAPEYQLLDWDILACLFILQEHPESFEPYKQADIIADGDKADNDQPDVIAEGNKADNEHADTKFGYLPVLPLDQYSDSTTSNVMNEVKDIVNIDKSKIWMGILQIDKNHYFSVFIYESDSKTQIAYCNPSFPGSSKDYTNQIIESKLRKIYPYSVIQNYSVAQQFNDSDCALACAQTLSDAKYNQAVYVDKTGKLIVDTNRFLLNGNNHVGNENKLLKKFQDNRAKWEHDLTLLTELSMIYPDGSKVYFGKYSFQANKHFRSLKAQTKNLLDLIISTFDHNKTTQGQLEKYIEKHPLPPVLIDDELGQIIGDFISSDKNIKCYEDSCTELTILQAEYSSEPINDVVLNIREALLNKVKSLYNELFYDKLLTTFKNYLRPKLSPNDFDRSSHFTEEAFARHYESFISSLEEKDLQVIMERDLLDSAKRHLFAKTKLEASKLLPRTSSSSTFNRPYDGCGGVSYSTAQGNMASDSQSNSNQSNAETARYAQILQGLIKELNKYPDVPEGFSISFWKTNHTQQELVGDITDKCGHWIDHINKLIEINDFNTLPGQHAAIAFTLDNAMENAKTSISDDPLAPTNLIRPFLYLFLYPNEDVQRTYRRADNLEQVYVSTDIFSTPIEGREYLDRRIEKKLITISQNGDAFDHTAERHCSKEKLKNTNVELPSCDYTYRQ